MLKKSKELLNSELTDQQRNQSLRSFRTEQYESKIFDLSNQVKQLRDKLHSLENEHKQESQTQKMLHNLQVENARLQRENKALRIKVQELEAKVRYSAQDKYELGSVKSLGSGPKQPKIKNEQNISGQSSKIESRFTATTTHLLRELLAECNEPSECVSSIKNDKLKDEFYQFKHSADCFQPWISQLTKQEKIRLKRCLTREKQLLWTSSQAEIGCISPYNILHSDPAQYCTMLVVFTNISPQNISKITMSPLFAKDVDFKRQNQKVTGRWQYAGELAFNEQIKEELQFTINNIDFRCVQLQLSYEIQGETFNTLLILPISKVKLFKNVAYSAAPPKCQRIQRVFEYERRVLSGVDRLGKLWQVVEGSEKVGKMYNWKISFLNRFFWLQAWAVQQKLMIGVRFESERALAQKVLEQYIFIFQKL